MTKELYRVIGHRFSVKRVQLKEAINDILNDMVTKLATIALVILIVLLGSCGYFDNDKAILDKQICGKFKIRQQQNSTAPRLIFEDSERGGLVIVQDCERVLFDSAHKIIFTESILNKYNKDYHQIQILIDSPVTTAMSYKMRTIGKEKFDSVALDPKKVFFVKKSSE